jgi:type I restriction enzyme S subunit
MMAFPKYESYKETGVQWLGEIPSHWSIKRLKFIVSMKTGERDTIDRQEYGKYPFFVRSKTVERIDSYSCDEEAVLTAGDGDIGKIFHYINGKFDYHQRVYKFSRFKEISGKFLFYYMQATLYEEVIKLSAKSTVDSLRLPMLLNFPVVYGRLDEQKCIVDFLDKKINEIDEAINQKQRIIELLQEQKSILINQAVTKGLNPKSPMRDSGIEWLGEIPEHWEVRQIKRLFAELDERSVEGTETLLSLRMYEGLVPHTEVSDKPITSNGLIGYKRVKPGELVMNRMRAALGLFALASTEGIVSPDYAIFRSIVDLIPDFYVHIFKTSKMKNIFLLESKGLGTGAAGFLRLYSDRFGWIKVPVPPVKEQVEIISHIEHITNEFAIVISKINDEISLLQELKNLTIFNAITGKIKV